VWMPRFACPECAGDVIGAADDGGVVCMPCGRLFSIRGGVWRFLTDERHALFTAVVAGESQARTGATARLAVDSRRFHYFDPATGDLVGGARADASAAAR